MNIKNVLDLILMHYREDDSIDHKILKEMNEAAAKKKVDYILSIAKQKYSNEENEIKDEMEI